MFVRTLFFLSWFALFVVCRAAEPSPPSWNIERTVFYKFNNKEARAKALAKLDAFFRTRGYEKHGYPEGTNSGYSKSVLGGTTLDISYDVPADEPGYQLRFSIHAYILDGLPSRFAAVTEEARRFFVEYEKMLDAHSYRGPYVIPGPP